MKNIILYDGNCFYCNKFILGVIKNDKGIFNIIDQNNNYFKIFKNKFSIIDNEETIYYIDTNEIIYKKSDAILKIYEKCSIEYKIIAFFLILVPKFIRDYFYKLFSKNRNSLFKNNTCIIPTKEILNRTYKE